MDETNVTPPEQETAPVAVTESAPVENTENQSVEPEPQTNEEWAKRRIDSEKQELKQRIADLESQLQDNRPNPFEVTRTPAPQEAQTEVAPNWNQFGYVDPNKVAADAEARAATVVKETLDEERTRRDFPQMKDPTFEQIVANNWFVKKTQNQPVSIYDEAKALSNWWNKATQKDQEAAVQKAMSEVTPKEAASLETTQNSQASKSQATQDDLESLRRRSRGQGDSAISAIQERLKGIPPE